MDSKRSSPWTLHQRENEREPIPAAEGMRVSTLVSADSVLLRLSPTLLPMSPLVKDRRESPHTPILHTMGGNLPGVMHSILPG